MELLINFLIIIIVVIVLLIIILIIIHSVKKKRIIDRMNIEVNDALKQLVEQSNNKYSYEKISNEVYDYILTSNKYQYYIKVIPNLNNEDICINSALKWNYGKNIGIENKKEVKENEELIRLDIKKEKNGKKPRKLFIIYPDAKSLIMVVNECEYEFVDSDTDVYGNNIITYNYFINNLFNSIEL